MPTPEEIRQMEHRHIKISYNQMKKIIKKIYG